MSQWATCAVGPLTRGPNTIPRDQWAALRAEPSGWDNAVEEVLRYDSPVQITGRTAKADSPVLRV